MLFIGLSTTKLPFHASDEPKNKSFHRHSTTIMKLSQIHLSRNTLHFYYTGQEDHKLIFVGKDIKKYFKKK